MIDLSHIYNDNCDHPRQFITVTHLAHNMAGCKYGGPTRVQKCSVCGAVKTGGSYWLFPRIINKHKGT